MKRILIVIMSLGLLLIGCTTTTSGTSQSSSNTNELSQNLNKSSIVKGPKKRVAVLKFENKTGKIFSEGNDLGGGIADMLITDLFKSGNFTIIERQELESVMKEQALGNMGAISSESAAELGKLIGANAIVVGSVTEYGLKREKNEINSEYLENKKNKVLNKFGLNKDIARVALDIRMIDTTSGEVILADSAFGESVTKKIKYVSSELPSIVIGGEKFDQTLVGKATRAAVNKVVANISKSMNKITWKGYILKVEGASVIINSGNQMGIENGMKFDVRSYGESITDAEGKTFTIPGKIIGEIEIITAMPSISKAKIITGVGMIKKDFEIILK